MKAYVLAKIGLDSFLAALQAEYEVLGPVARDEEFVFAPLGPAADLRLDYDTTILPPHKKYFLPPREDLFAYGEPSRHSTSFLPESSKRILFGLHACDVNSLISLDRVFLGTYPDPYYKARREDTLIIGINCNQACKNGFCTSLNNGPSMDEGYDLALTDLGDRYLVQAATSAGESLAKGLDPAADADWIQRSRLIRAAQESFSRRFDSNRLGELLHNNTEHPKWDELKDICLACGSCTNVCPTCFCFGVRDYVDLSLAEGVRQREWDSCQYLEFSRVAQDHIFRPDRGARIKQRIYHKLTYYEQQFGVDGCVGCGRCVTYCIVHIDPVDIVNSIRANPAPDKEVVIFQAAEERVCPDKSPWEPQPAVVKSIKRQNYDNITYTFQFTDPSIQAAYSYNPGVFNMISLFGLGEVPISISSCDDGADTFDHTIRAVGNVTNVLAEFQPGDMVGIRGPYGTGWPIEAMKGHNVLLVAGGIGLAPLRPVIKYIQSHRREFGDFEILYGARTPSDMLFVDELDEYRQIPDTRLYLTVDNPAGAPWNDNVGVVTTLFDKMALTPANTVMVTCGPDIMMKFVVKDLLSRGFSPEQLYVSLERRMSCGIKKCGNCQIGPVFVCQDGPVFRFADIKDLPEEAL